MRKVQLKKVQKASSNWGHYGRNSGLVGASPAQWAVYVDGKLIGTAVKVTDQEWAVLDAECRYVRHNGITLAHWTRAKLVQQIERAFA